MNVNGFTQRPGRPARIGLCLLLLGMGWLFSVPAQAAPVRRYTVPAGELPVFRAWSNHLSAGPQVWSTRRPPPFTPGIQSTIWQVLRTDSPAQALNNPMIDYLLWRRSLNPVRFDSNHSRLGPSLSQLLTLQPPTTSPGLPPPNAVPQVPAPTRPQTVESPPIISPRPQEPPAPIPEPSSLLVAVGILGFGVMYRRLRGRLVIAESTQAQTRS
jgi:hypothetical protein